MTRTHTTLALAALTLAAVLPQAARAQQTLYASTESNTIDAFSSSGTRSLFAGTGRAYPQGLAFDSAGNLYAANQNNNTIEKFTPGGTPSTFASTGLRAPYGLAFDSAGNLYAANQNNNTIEKFTPDGTASLFATEPKTLLFLAFAPAAPLPSGGTAPRRTGHRAARPIRPRHHSPQRKANA